MCSKYIEGRLASYAGQPDMSAGFLLKKARNNWRESGILIYQYLLTGVVG
jgi:hypothetical protein